MKIKEGYKNILFYVTLSITVQILTIVFLNLWKFNLHVPLAYGADSLLTSMTIKGIVQNGWFLHNRFLSAPGTLNFNDFPTCDNFHYIIIFLITKFSKDWAISLNLFYLLTFILTALTSAFALRQLKISFFSSFMGSILFTFLPYHFMRGINHLFLASYYIIPLSILVCMWILNNDNNLDFNLFKGNTLSKNRWKVVLSILVCIVTSGSGIYYAYFFCIFICICAIVNFIKYKNIKMLVSTLFYLLTTVIGILFNLLPSIYHIIVNGKNSVIGIRSPIESEVYGLKITQLILPISRHRIPILSKLKEIYNSSAPLINENDTASLGFIISCGFVFMLLYMVFYRRNSKNDNNIYSLSVLNICAVLIGTIGGLGAIIALLVSPQIRAYNRISVYIAFFSIITICILVDKIDNYSKTLKTLAISTILIVGLFDQTSAGFIPPYKWLQTEYYNDKAFIEKIEKVLSEDSMVFQLPYVNFPENPPVNNMGDYEHFRAYLHSTSIRWSYGSMKGRQWAEWQKQISTKPIPEFIEEITLSDFKGIYIDRKGFVDGGEKVINEIKTVINESPIISENERLVFFNLSNYSNVLKSKYSPLEYRIKQNAALNPTIINWGKGFFNLEFNGKEHWRWSENESEIIIFNLSDEKRVYDIKMDIISGNEKPSTMLIYGDLINKKIETNNIGTKIEMQIVVSPGEHKIWFNSKANKVYAPNDPRKLYFRITNFSFEQKIKEATNHDQ